MTLYFRLLWLWGLNKFREELDFATDTSELNLRVLPNDLDFNMHMNNGRYLVVMDLGRQDLMTRSGMFETIRKKGWMPVLGSANIRYRRPLPPLQKYKLETSFAGWDDKWFYLEQKFTITSGKEKGELAAYAVVKGAFVGVKSGKAEKVADVMRAIGREGLTMDLPEHIKGYIRSEEALKKQGQASQKPKDNPPKPPRP